MEAFIKQLFEHHLKGVRKALYESESFTADVEHNMDNIEGAFYTVYSMLLEHVDKNTIDEKIEYTVRGELPREVRRLIVPRDDEKIIDVLDTEFNSELYADALYKLSEYEIIIITGEPQVGKTTLALQLAHHIKCEKGLDRILLDRYGKTGIENFKEVKNSVIIFDDALGKPSDEKYSDYAHNTGQVMELKSNPLNNYIIMTIDSQILERIKNDQTRFGEYLGNIEIVKLNKNEEV